MKKFNHNLDSVSMNFVAKAGSRNRLRVPVAGTRFNNIAPGDRVLVASAGKQIVISKVDPNRVKNRLNLYTVEKDGAIRIPAHKFGLPVVKAKIACDSLTKMVLVL